MDGSLSNRLTNKKSASGFGALFFAFLIIIPVEGIASSMAPASLKAEVGVSALRFDYAEFDDNGRVLDKEMGGIPGLSIKLSLRQAAWEWETAGSFHGGQVPYTGQTNSGVPYNTRTDESIGDVSIRLGRWFGDRVPVMPFVGIGYRRWDRNILPNSLGSLFESYRWTYVWAGSKIMTYQKGASNFILDVGLLKPVKPELRVDFRNTYNVEPVVYPEGKIGLRVLLTSNLALSKRAGLTIEPYYEFWELGRSPNVTDGAVTVYEPASKTRNMGLNLRLGWTW
jgi:hypothetical protein